MHWDKDPLIAKAKLYIQRAFEMESREGELLPFWATIGLEFAGRAVLASVHPSLLADPQTPEAVLFACGIGNPSSAKSVHAKTVFARCKLIVPEFSQSDFAFCMSLMNRRNMELHTAAAAFEGFSTGTWLADYYRVLERLLKHLALQLTDVLSADDAIAAAQMIAAAAKDLLSEVNRKLEHHRKTFHQLAAEVINERRAAFLVRRPSFRGPTKDAKCPACGDNCVISGYVIRSTPPRLVKDELYWESIVLPTTLRCEVCGLELKGHEALHIAALGGQFSVLRIENAEDHYLEGVDPSRFIEEEYQNS